MKRILIAAACLSLAACGAKPATFQVQANDFVKATLSLCGQESPMKQTGNTFAVDRRITCSGAGEIRLVHKTGPETICQIQSATPGFPGRWTFMAAGPECVLGSLESKDVKSSETAVNAPAKKP